MLEIKLDRICGQWVAFAPFMVHFGYGDSIPEALEDCLKRNEIDSYTWK